MRSKIVLSILLMVVFSCCTGKSEKPGKPETTEKLVSDLTLKNYRPRSLYNIPKTLIEKAAYPVIDMHSHDYAANEQDIQKWVTTMKNKGIEKTVILSQETGAGFDSVVEKYSKFPQEFELWCGIDYTGYNTDKNWTEHAIKELERCYA